MEIVTELSECTYIFGTFVTIQETQVEQAGYIEDLEEEGPKKIPLQIKQYQPILGV